VWVFEPQRSGRDSRHILRRTSRRMPIDALAVVYARGADPLGSIEDFDHRPGRTSLVKPILALDHHWPRTLRSDAEARGCCYCVDSWPEAVSHSSAPKGALQPGEITGRPWSPTTA